jgi:hypothetical protein
MAIDFGPFLTLWLVLIAVVIVLAFWRRAVASHEDDTLHLRTADAGTPALQVATAQKLAQIDKWGKLLTALAVIMGVLLGAAYLYKGWVMRPGAGL